MKNVFDTLPVTMYFHSWNDAVFIDCSENVWSRYQAQKNSQWYVEESWKYLHIVGKLLITTWQEWRALCIEPI